MTASPARSRKSESMASLILERTCAKGLLPAEPWPGSWAAGVGWCGVGESPRSLGTHVPVGAHTLTAPLRLDFQSAWTSQTVADHRDPSPSQTVADRSDPSPLRWEGRQGRVLLAVRSGSHIQRQGGGNTKRAQATLEAPWR